MLVTLRALLAEALSPGKATQVIQVKRDSPE